MPKTYFIISQGSEMHVAGPLTEAEVLRRITPDADGETYYGRDKKFLPAIPKEGVEYLGENDLVIIRGEITVPRPVTTVTKFKV
jgi:hypothetical protein